MEQELNLDYEIAKGNLTELMNNVLDLSLYYKPIPANIAVGLITIMQNMNERILSLEK